MQESSGATLEEINEFTLEMHTGDYEKWPRKTKLFKNGEYVERKIHGYWIERQFRMGDYYFLIVTYDCPFEEQCDLLLLDGRCKTVARRSLMPWNYSSFLPDRYECSGGNAIKVSFTDGRELEIELQPAKWWLLDGRIVFKKWTRSR